MYCLLEGHNRLVMDKIYDHNLTESKWYSFWEKNKYFTPKIDKKKTPFTIIMPPPNANGELHIGHATFIVVEDILIRYHRMKGDPTLWLTGADHAGILTQVVYERELGKQGKSRFDLGRKEFFKQTYNFTITNTSSADTPDLILDSVIDDVLGDLTALAFAAGGDVLTDGEIVNFSTTRTALITDPSPLVNVVTVLYHPEGFPNDVTDDDDHSVIVWICLDTTAWAAQGNPGQTRFIPDQGDWATWITYNVEDGSDVEPWEYPLFTGQTHRSGTLYVYDEGGMLYVKYSIDGQDPEYIEGYDGEWIGLSKYHLQVVDEFAGFSPYLTKKGGAIPGQFDLSGSLDKDPETDWIGVDISSYGDDDIYIAAHAIMWWLGVPE